MPGGQKENMAEIRIKRRTRRVRADEVSASGPGMAPEDMDSASFFSGDVPQTGFLASSAVFSSSSDFEALYAQALSGLARALGPALEDGSGGSLSAAAPAQGNGQADARDGLMNADTAKTKGSSSSVNGGPPGVTVNISGITIKSMEGADNTGGLARQIEDAIAQSIQRNASPIVAALKEVGAIKK